MSMNERCPILRGDHIALCPLFDDLVPLYAQWINDLGTALLVGRLPPIGIAEERDWVRTYSASERGCGFTLFQMDNGAPVGVATFDLRSREHRSANLGILIASGSRQVGIGTEAFELLFDYGFNAMNLHRIEGQSFIFNPACLKMGTALGARDVGRLRDAVFAGGTFHDLVVQDTIEEDYRKLGLRSRVRELVPGLTR